MSTPEHGAQGAYEALRASHRALLEMLVQLLEEVVYPLDTLMPAIENIIAKAEALEKKDQP